MKAQIRRKQREMAELRMMDAVKEADVVITNPEHFAVALVYDPESDGAPIVVAKGLIMLHCGYEMRRKEHGVVQVEIPPLAVHCISPPISIKRFQRICITRWLR